MPNGCESKRLIRDSHGDRIIIERARLQDTDRLNAGEMARGIVTDVKDAECASTTNRVVQCGVSNHLAAGTLSRDMSDRGFSLD